MRYLIIYLLMTASTIFAKEKAYIIRPLEKSSFSKIVEYSSIECSYPDGSLLIYIDDSNFPKIEKYLSDYQEKIFQLPKDLKTGNTLQELKMKWDTYPSFTVYMEFLNDLKTKYPNLIELDTIGLSYENHPLVFIHFKGANKPKPEFMYSSSLHGNELTGFILLMRLSDYLASNYNSNSIEGARVTNLIDNLDIWIMPLNNPDGTYPLTDTTVIYSKRTNVNGIDLNRNFPDQYKDNYNTNVGREKETALVMDFVKKHNFCLSANFHTGTSVANYPWDGLEDGSIDSREHNCPDSLWFIELAKAYADVNPDFKNSTEFDGGITNGTAWYSLYGGRQDWMYVFQKGREITIELTNEGILGSDELLRQWDINKESLLRYAEMGTRGIHGVVVDENDKPISALIRLNQIPETDIITNPTNGFFARYTHSGKYSIQVIAEGYETCIIDNINLEDTNYVFLKIKFRTDKRANISDFNNELISNYNNNLYVDLSTNKIKANQLIIYNLNGSIEMKQSILPDQLNKYDLSGLSSGIYFVVIDDASGTIFKKILKN